MGDTKIFEDLVEFLKQKRDNVTFIDIIRLAEIASQSLQAFFTTFDATVYRELREIAGYIDAMRQEMGALQANEIKNSRIPAAGQELSEIVKATENATNTIMECAETLMAADASNPAAYKALVDEKMVLIFEACSFQDITGQRITKVVRALQHIESRVDALTSACGSVIEKEREAVSDDQALLNGPQLGRNAATQSEIDSLFDSIELPS